ncbi:Uncharacterized protein OS=Pirellula staleyi (strain ATCC 27377 / DSM 6068 / ICPB 4128) GN=Psta_1268 PE=4 SV=1 [Gemmataceae bacterium]|nr:Uncharacterized protein OS=Pirellula staleyi (strain ATCC 27377 / DSM 6068 / ICPB 4128) GN=Psta_1268 PE=4 SV=1 [Gemmataceae bacterium]VTT98392.1 Uncharacterized protein OS=Pirellula staleyi (strain ATCC 27377 / DSM 6068 / ICPB 4128) GN=Psta_1268 PE=4 SV=1 [Gemmataceae bacterium]
MFRTVVALAALALFLAPAAGEDKKDAKKPTVELGGSIDDESLQTLAPASGVIASEKAWEKLAKAWGVKDAPKVDFTKELLAVGTWKGSSFSVVPLVADGDLTVSGRGTKDLRPGFRWKVVSVSRDGIKTVQGKEIPKE